MFSAALREYVARHAPDEVTTALNDVCDDLGKSDTKFAAAAARRRLKNSEW